MEPGRIREQSPARGLMDGGWQPPAHKCDTNCGADATVMLRDCYLCAPCACDMLGIVRLDRRHRRHHA